MLIECGKQYLKNGQKRETKLMQIYLSVKGGRIFSLFPCYLCVTRKWSRFGSIDKLVRMDFLHSQELRRKSDSVECVASRRTNKERKIQYRSAH